MTANTMQIKESADMTHDQNTFIRLVDARAALEAAGAGVTHIAGLAAVERFQLTDGYESNEAGISELHDAEGRTLSSDGRRARNS